MTMNADNALVVFPWNVNFETGIPIIDDQHRRLFELINRLASSLSRGDDAADLDVVFGELATYAEYHFKTEEEVWRGALGDDPWFVRHCQSHGAFKPRVLELMAEKGEVNYEKALGDTLNFLVNWLVFHILESDRHLGKVVLAVGDGLGREAAKQRADEEMSGVMQTVVKTVMTMYESLTTHSIALIREKNRRLHAERALSKSQQAIDMANRLNRSMEQMIIAMSSTIELRSPYTAGHQRRVALLVREIALAMGLSEDEVHGCFLAATIHDIGDIEVPAEILVRPAKLSPLEFQLVKRHSQTGYDLLKDIDFPWSIAEIILQHHERLDGSGYPRGLKGDDIILGARIIAVADVVEAMSSHRPYRPAHGIDMALAEVERGKGTKFDPRVVDACTRVFKAGFAFPR
jgi:hemerythrin-like metal-binding protein